MRGSVTQACRATLSGDENVRKCCLSVSCYTLWRRIVWVSLPKSPLHPYVILPCTFRQRKWAEVSPESVVLHPRATKMRGSVTQAYRILLLGDEKYGFRCRRVPLILTSFCPTPTGNKKGRKCRLNVSCRTFGRRRSAEVSLKRAALHPRATKMRDSVAQACRAAPSSDKKARNCCSSVPCCTPRRRKVWVSLPRSPIHPYVILPCTFRQRKWAEVSPERVVPHSRATKKR